MRHPFSYLLVLLSLLLSGCDSMPLTPAQEKLRTTLRSYEVTLRWTNIADAYKYLIPELAEQALPPADIGNIKITDYEVVSPPTIVGNRARQQVRIRYIFQDRQLVKEVLDNQEWLDHPEAGWRRSNPIPNFQ